MLVVILITCANKPEANKIAKRLVADKLAACVNIIGRIESLFWWQGKLDQAGEVLLMAKTRKQLLAKLIRRVKSMHSYSVPEIIALPIVGGSPSFLKWVKDVTRYG